MPSVCVKVFREKVSMHLYSQTEVILTSKLCHLDLPWLYGIVLKNQKMVNLCFHREVVNSRSLCQVLQMHNIIATGLLEKKGYGGLICQVHIIIHYSGIHL